MANTLFDALIAPHARNPNAFLRRIGARDISFAEFVAMTGQMANALVGAGLRPGDRVVVQAPKTVEMVVLYAATLRAGAVFLPLNTAYTLDELDYFVTDAAPRLIVCTSAAEESMNTLAQKVSAQVLSLDADGSGTLASAAWAQSSVFETVERRPEDLAALLYTSGTTGRSKGAMLTHANLLSNAQALVDAWQITDADRLVHALPIFHTHGLFVALNTSFLAGVALDFMPAFDLDAILNALPNATMLMGVPTFYTRLLGDTRLTKDLCANMRLFVSGSAPLLPETHVEFTQRTGHYILERYGMTETNMNTSNPYNGDRRPGTVGQPLPGVEVALTDPESGAPVQKGGVGMIEVRGANVFSGYWQMPEKTAAELRDSGFFITGDLGQFSDDGYLTIVGRAKDLIITGGYNVYPREIEEVLNAVPGVIESAVFGVPHADFGEAILAAIVPDPSEAFDEDLCRSLVVEKLARFKHPRRYECMDALPRNTMGKVQKNVLRDTYSAQT